MISANDGQRDAVDRDNQVLLAETELADLELGVERDAHHRIGFISAAPGKEHQIVDAVRYRAQVQRAERGEKKGSEMTNGIFFAITGSPFSNGPSGCISRRPPMPHPQPLRNPRPGHRGFCAQAHRHSHFPGIPFAPPPQFRFRPTRLA